MALVSKVGGAAGPLYGTLFLQMGNATGGRSELDLAGWSEALDAGLKGVVARGKAEPEDKTMVDALTPAVQALERAETTAPTSRLRLRSRPRRRTKGWRRRCRWWHARGAPATWGSEARVIRTPARRRPPAAPAAVDSFG